MHVSEKHNIWMRKKALNYKCFFRHNLIFVPYMDVPQ